MRAKEKHKHTKKNDKEKGTGITNYWGYWLYTWSKPSVFMRHIFHEISRSPRKSHFRGKAYFSEHFDVSQNDFRRKLLSHANRPRNSFIANIIIIFYYERSELLIYDGKKRVRKKRVRNKTLFHLRWMLRRFRCVQIFLKNVRRRRPRRCNYWPIISMKSTVRTVLPIYFGARDPSGERQRAPSTPQQWGPPSLHRSFRRVTASTVHAAAVGSA